MRRRFNIIPFRHKPARVDRTLEHRLTAEHGRILQWMIEGCLDWQAHGLVRPTSVTEQTEQYFADQDLLAQFIADRCELDTSFHEEMGRLFAAWEKYAHAAGDHAGNKRTFGTDLRNRGFRPDRLNVGARQRIYRGLRLVAADELPISHNNSGQQPKNWDVDAAAI